MYSLIFNILKTNLKVEAYYKGRRKSKGIRRNIKTRKAGRDIYDQKDTQTHTDICI